MLKLNVPGVYLLEISFKDSIDTDSIDAKWDKKMKKLKLKLIKLD
jgi:hypothetical protein